MYASHKRLVVFCDGTNQDGLVCTDDGTDPGGGTPLYFTNVLRLSRAVRNTHKGFMGMQNMLQIVFYQSGVGTDNDFKGHASSAELATELFGTMVARKIRDCYNFIAQNYVPGDEIYLFGFSRGAYTARKVAGLIDRVGLLDPKHMGKFYPYLYSLETGKGDLPERPATPVPIKLIGVWDTVGALRNSLLQPFPGLVNQLGIDDATLPANVQVAFHAMAFHENRNWFQCTPFVIPDESKQSEEEKAQRQGQILKQVWFGGEHSDCGGGWDQHELADISLLWMASEVAQYLDIDEEMILEAIRPHPEKPAWGESVPHNSYELTTEAIALVGHIEPSTRLAGGHITKDSVFHSSILSSPRPSDDPFVPLIDIVTPGTDDKKKDDDEKHNANAAGKAKGETGIPILKALGKHMITLDDLKKQFGDTWEPATIPLNPLEEKGKAIWKKADTRTDDQATYESRQQIKELEHGQTDDAKNTSAQ